MRLLDRYILKNFFRVILFIFMTIGVIIMIVNIFEKIDYFIDNKARFIYVIEYYVYWLPFQIVMVMPIGVLLATLMVISNLSRNGELIAMKSCGLSLWRILIPLLAVGVLISVVSLALSEIVPYTNQQLKNLQRVKIEQKPPQPTLSQNKVFYIGSKGHMYFIDYFDAKKQRLHRVTVFEYDEYSRLLRRIDAERAAYRDSTWVFEDGMERLFSANGQEVAQAFRQRPLPELEEAPEDFSRYYKFPNQMNYLELREYIQKTKRSGANSESIRQDEVDLYLKIAYPFSNLIILFFGAPLSLSTRRSSPALSVILSISVAFVYWTMIQLGKALGHGGYLTPLMAAWLPNTVFAALGLIALIRAPK